jgi:sodium transport system permease protein
LIFVRELRDQLRDPRTLFTVAVLPLLLYPLLGISVFQVQQSLRERPCKVRIVGTSHLPPAPALVQQGQFAVPHPPWPLELDIVAESRQSADDLQQAAQHDLELGVCDVVVVFPPDFAAQLAALRRKKPAKPPETAADHAADDLAADDLGKSLAKQIPQPRILYSAARDASNIAMQRVERILETWRQMLVEENLRASQLPVAVVRPFEPQPTDVAQEQRRRAALWSKILPFVLMVWALTGAFYPAVDLCAGEKERGTLETLLSSPAARSEIVWGKLLTVMAFSIVTALFNLASMIATGTFILAQLQQIGAARLPVEVGPPPWSALVWLTLALLPIAALFSALALAIAAFARSSKEGQYYLMPLLMISLPLMMLPLLPAAQMDLGYALIPLSGLMLLLRTLIEGHYGEALRYLLPVAAVTAGCCWLAIRWAIDQFHDETVLFRDSERFGLGLWLRHLVRDRQDTPTAAEALLCGVLLLILRFFAGLTMPPPTSWPQFFTANLIVQIALIASPPALMAVVLTRRPLVSLGLRPPTPLRALPAAALLALLLHPALSTLAHLVQRLYPLSPAVQQQLAPLVEHLARQPLTQVLCLIALAPAICEELAFRGFILSGLRRSGHRWGAIALSSAFFGLAHFMLQQSLAAAVVGLVLGYLAIQTGSIVPCTVYHFVHNSLTVLVGRLPADASAWPAPLPYVLHWDANQGAPVYAWPALLVATLAALGLLLWFRSLPCRQTSEEWLHERLEDEDRRPAHELVA